MVPMALSVRDVMDADPAFVYTGDPTERVLEVLREHELPGIPVINEGDRCVGIITERDLILSGESEDLHLPHYFQLFGGFVFVERFGHFEERLRKAVAATAEDLMTPDPVTIEPCATVEEGAGGRGGRARPGPPPRRAQAGDGGRARPARRRPHAPRRARGADPGVDVRA